MGCDIHAMVEVQKQKYPNGSEYWVDAGTPLIPRDYLLFSILGNVRNGDNISYIGEKRLKVDSSEDAVYPHTAGEDYDESATCEEFTCLVRYWEDDGHSHSYVTLQEMEEYYFMHTNSLTHLISQVSCIAAGHGVIDPNKVRLVFFFDN